MSEKTEIKTFANASTITRSELDEWLLHAFQDTLVGDQVAMVLRSWTHHYKLDNPETEYWKSKDVALLHNVQTPCYQILVCTPDAMGTFILFLNEHGKVFEAQVRMVPACEDTRLVR
jgi:hypothetical protein